MRSLSSRIGAVALLSIPAIAAGKGGELEWNARNVEHLLNRAAFGATDEEIATALKSKPAEFVEQLMTTKVAWKHVEPELIRWEDFDLDPRGIPVDEAHSKYKGMAKKDIAAIVKPLRQRDRQQFVDYGDRWFGAMLHGDDPVRDHATLFWHGFFTTSFSVVRRKYEVINQHQFLRDHALGSFRDLLHGIVEDPAMLQYLDNNTNIKGHANENLARELMELFSLGEGHYTEVDVREAARALTGAWADPEGHFQFQAENHDDGEKTILSKTGKFKGKELVDIILDQPACPRWVALKLLTYYEGTPPSEARLADYAKFLRDSDYHIDAFLKRLFLDPAFYRDEIVGARIQGPIEYVVGLCKKLGLEPPSNFIFSVTSDLGQCFYDPPTVKGWDGGETWITNAWLMGRGNTAGVLVDAFDDKPDDDASMSATANTEMSDDQLDEHVKQLTVSKLKTLARVGDWSPKLDLAGAARKNGATSDAQVVDWALGEWLAVEPSSGLRDVLVKQIAAERKLANLGDKPLSECGDQGERVMRRLAYIVFSLPEAQLD